MTGTIYSGRYRIGSNGTYSGITLNQSPATLAGYLYVNSGAAIIGSAGTAWTFSNQGLLIDYGMGSQAGHYGSLNNPGGIDLLSGGLVINGNTGSNGQGQITGGGSFYADGRIEETTVGVAITGGAGTVVNYGSIKSSGLGVYLGNGGTILNGTAADTIASIAAAVVVAGAPGVIGNYATIGHGGELGGNGIVLEAGGVVTNAASGYLRNGTTISGAAGTIFNAGRLNHSVSLTAGGLVANEAGGRIVYGVYFSGAAAELLNAGSVSGVAIFGAAGTVANTGTMTGGLFGVSIATTGSVINGQSGSAAGLIAGSVMGVTIGGTGGLVINYGEIESLNAMPGAGVQLAGPGTIRNAGTIFETGGYKSAAAASLPGGGLLLNSGEILGTPLGAFGIGATISNSGLIGATPTGGALGAAVELEGGLLTNTGTAETAGAMATGVDLVGGGTIVNQGLIRAAGTSGSSTAAGVYINGGGTVLNAGTILAGLSTTGSSSLPIGIEVTGTVGVSLANFGTISSSIGVLVARYQRTGTNGNYGRIDPRPNVTLLNAGLIVGTGTTVSGAPTYLGAVRFGDGNNLLIVQPGAAFTGVVLGGTGSNALELATGTATGYGMLNGLGTSFTNFGTVRVDPGADWQVSGSLASGVTLTNNGTLLANATTLIDSTPLLAGSGTVEVAGHGLAELLTTVAATQTARFIDLVGTLAIGSLGGFAGTIAGFAGGDTISLLGVTASSAAYGNHQLTISNGTTALGKLAVATNFTGDKFTVTEDSAGNADITTNAPCFAAGTRLRTPAGDIAVERLTPGMEVVTVTGAPLTVTWLGRRRIDCRRHPRPELVQPIRVAADAFGHGAPCRPLLLSPDHAVFVDTVLIPICHLVNGRSIRQLAPATVEYWHVELERHAVLLAEGLPAESYLDTGNRAAFSNGAACLDLHPEFARRSWREACAELVQDGPRLVAVRRRLFHRAGLPPASPAPALAVRAGAATLAPWILSSGHWRYRLPRGAAMLDLISPAWVPAHCQPDALDRRRLGVRIFALSFDGIGGAFESFGSGFHPLETTAEGPCRWTTGHARVPVPPGAASLDIAVGDQAVPGIRARPYAPEPRASARSRL